MHRLAHITYKKLRHLKDNPHFALCIVSLGPAFQIFQAIQELAVGDAKGPWTRTGPLSVASKDCPQNLQFTELW